MQIHQLQRVHPNMKRMIVARGGKRGKTAGRGGKGQTARAGNKRRPEWRDIIKKLPKLRGRGVNQHKPVSQKPMVVNLAIIEGTFSANDIVTPTTLVEKGVVSTWSGKIPVIKILGEGDITKALKVSGCEISESAQAKIEKAGGTVTLLKPRVIAPVRVQEKPAVEAPVKAKVAKPATKKADAPAEKKAAPKTAKKAAEAK